MPRHPYSNGSHARLFIWVFRFLQTRLQLVPEETTTIISQIALSVFGQNVLYYLFQIATIAILVVAANTAFADFPRLSSILARDDYMPHQFQFRGDRLAFTTGNHRTGAIASLLVILFRGMSRSLINLYAIGCSWRSFFLTPAWSRVGCARKPLAGEKASRLTPRVPVLTFTILIIAILTKFASAAG